MRRDVGDDLLTIFFFFFDNQVIVMNVNDDSFEFFKI